MDNDVVIQVQDLSKAYKLYNDPIDRLKESLHPFGKKYYKEFYAIRDLNFTIRKGEMVGIIGRNGSGKSTLLKMLTGVLTATAGTMQVNGRISALLELGTGFNPDFTGIENIYFHGTIMGYTKQEMDSKLDDILEFADIGDFINQPVKMYSSGMFVRLAFSVAIAIEPDILIIDEALAVGDLRFQQKAIRKMKSLMGKAKAILFVSHDMRSIRTFCNRVIWLSDGQLFQSGDPKEIARMYEDYMIHDVLPSSEKTKDISQDNLALGTPQIQQQNSSGVQQQVHWEDVSSSNSVGGTTAQFRKIAVSLPPTKNEQELQGGEQMTIYATLQVQAAVEKPLLGFGIFNDKGMPMVHFNSETILCTLEPFAANSEVCIKYQLPLPNLRNGTYFISVGLDDGEMDCHTVVHHVNDFYSFKINRQDCYGKQHGNIIVENARIDIV